MRKIIFSHKRALGDALMFTSGVRDFKQLFPNIEINVDSNFKDVWQNNPYLTTSLKKEDDGVEYYKVGYPIINNCNSSYMHFTQGFLYDMIAIADLHKPLGLSIGEFASVFANGTVGDPGLDATVENFTTLKNKYRVFGKTFGRQRADIHLSKAELKNNIIKKAYKIDKYWVVAPGGKTDCVCKIWDWRRFQDVIDYFDGRLKFVVIGKSDHIVEKLNNVIDLTDKFNSDIRGLFSLVYHSNGCVGGISFLMHLAAAVPPRRRMERKPCITIVGGREPTQFATYGTHQVLHSNGTLSCCDNGGCWHSRVIPLATNPKRNTRLCMLPLNVDGRTIPKCMDMISSQEVITAIEKYYNGNIYQYESYHKNIPVETKQESVIQQSTTNKEINVVASLSSKGGGEQSALFIVNLLRKDGWTVHLYPWDKLHDNYKDAQIEEYTFTEGMAEHMVSKIPLLFYANDQIGKFCDKAQEIVSKSSVVIIGINYINGALPKCNWLASSKKLKAIVFQNQEKLDEFKRAQFGFEDTKLICLFGAIDLNKFLEVCTPQRQKNKDLIILKHCVPDYRKYITTESARLGKKIHLWQKHIYKEPDIKFYARLLKDTKNTRFEFMEAHKELEQFFRKEKRMVFHKFDSISVTDFLSKGHIYLYRTSNAWRDQYPRVVAEALAAGLPVLSEPRDGTKDRMDFGNIGFHCIDYDAFLYAIKILNRKETYRQKMGIAAKDWARNNLDPKKWVETINDIICGN